MSNEEKAKRQAPGKSKLFRLKEWLTLAEAANYLSTIFGESVCVADVLRLGLDRHLKLSVNFVNHATARRGDNFIPFQEWEKIFRSKCTWENLEPFPGPDNKLIFCFFDYDFSFYLVDTPKVPKCDFGEKLLLETIKKEFLERLSTEQKSTTLAAAIEVAIKDHKKLSEKFGGKVPPAATTFRGEIRTIEGVWDLPLLGSERLDIEHEYQQLTGGPEITLTCLDGACVETLGGEVWQLQDRFDEEYLKNQYSEEGIKKKVDWYADVLKKKILNNEISEEEAEKRLEQRKKNLSIKRDPSHDYYPAGSLPDDSVLVVRTAALLDLQERVSEEQAESKPVSPKTEKSNLHIIGALLQIVMDENLFPSEEALREHLALQYQGYPGCAERTLAGRFAEAKKLLSE